MANKIHHSPQVALVSMCIAVRQGLSLALASI